MKVKPATSFTIKKDSRMSWANYKIGNGEVTFSATANSTTDNRSCFFVLINNNGNSVDTLEVIQAGKVSATAVKNVTKVISSASSTKSKYSTSKKTTTTIRRSTTSPSKGSYSGQCAATTKKGNRCSRQASAGSIYCWQHNK
ncbi:MAG: hypothetical protein IKX61_05220 [Prevotella sp.]|nr:hypothetical protein [Prevotella sp.]